MNLTSTDTELLEEGVKKAVELVDVQGLDPNDALAKVAKELNYTPGFLKVACTAFNTGRQLAQWESNTGILDKLAGFALADYEKICPMVWKAEEKKASVSFLNPEFKTYGDLDRESLLNADWSNVEKKAEAADKPLDIDRTYNQRDRLRRELSEARRVKSAADDLLNLKIYNLQSYFKKSAYDRIPFAQAEKAVSILFGKTGSMLMDYVYQHGPQEKRASDYAKSWTGFAAPADVTKAPYNLVKEAIDQALAVVRAENAVQTATEKLAAQENTIASFSPAPSVSNQEELTPFLISGGVKEAFAATDLYNQVRSIPKALSAKVEAGSDNTVNEFMNKLESPDHINELRKIRAQTVLTQLMSDPEDPISSADPEQVLATYNELIRLSPHMADQPAALRPVLRKALTGNPEPFETEQTLKTEKMLGETTPKPGYKEPEPKSAPTPKLEAPKQTNQKTPTDLMRNESDIIS